MYFFALRFNRLECVSLLLVKICNFELICQKYASLNAVIGLIENLCTVVDHLVILTVFRLTNVLQFLVIGSRTTAVFHFMNVPMKY